MPLTQSSIPAPGAFRCDGHAPNMSLHEQIGAGRAVAEAFICKWFANAFQARVTAFMPRLFTVRNETGDVCGAFGLRSARHSLFLERYLERPIEHEIALRIGHGVQRSAIVEVGQFCGTYPGMVRTMIRRLTEHLHEDGVDWVTFTGTQPLRNAFFRMGLAPIDICAADAGRLPTPERDGWGRYYEHAPRVLAGHVEGGYRKLVQDAAMLEAC